jgi:hypothetical protein
MNASRTDSTMALRNVSLLVLTLLLGSFSGAHTGELDAICALAGNRGGLVVHYDCGDGRLTAALGQRKDVVLQGLTRDADQVATARERIHASGLSGPVTIRLWTTQRLPYADEVVNVLLASEAIEGKEAARVLAPGGALLVKGSLNAAAAGLKDSESSSGWQSFVKPVPAEMDEWTHYLHAADNNAVANDSLVGPPRYLRWDGGPKYGRNHEIDASVISAVTGGGRLFYVVDEGPAGTMGQHLPHKWALIARDAFSGVILWLEYQAYKDAAPPTGDGVLIDHRNTFSSRK